MGTARVANILDPIHDTLDTRVWNDEGAPRPKLKPAHRKWIQRTVTHLAKQFAPDPERWVRLVLTGSLTTYQYADTSDCDVSLFVDPHFLPEWSRGKLIGLMVSSFDGTKLPGTPFEMQCFIVAKNISAADLYQPGLRSGYDIGSDQWIVPPDRSRMHDVEREYNVDYIYALESADKMERLLRYDPDKAVQFWHQIHKRRMRDQSAGKGDYSQANIVYKMLANRGLFPGLSEASGEYIAKVGGELPRWRQKRDPLGEYEQADPYQDFLKEEQEEQQEQPRYYKRKGIDYWRKRGFARPWKLGEWGKTMYDPRQGGVVAPWTTDGWGGPPFHADFGGGRNTTASAWITPEGHVYFPYEEDDPSPPEHINAVLKTMPGQRMTEKTYYRYMWGDDDDGWDDDPLKDNPLKDDSRKWESNVEKPRALFNKFQPSQTHPPGPEGPELPFVYDPGQGIVHIGPPNSFHWELIRRTPELRQQYDMGRDMMGAPFRENRDHVHGRLTWPGRESVFFGRPNPEHIEQTNAALGATTHHDQDYSESDWGDEDESDLLDLK